MDNHTKNHAPPGPHGSHAGHVCHKCGWPFPKPHPSAKHRRAHKKICGTVEGYKFVKSEETSLLPVSDPDEYLRTPSPNVLDQLKNEKESSASGLRSERSEDDMFSDAIAEFPDSGSSPKIEENVANVRNSSSIGETVETEDRSVVDRAINVMILPPSNQADSYSLVENADVPGSHLSDSAVDPQHDISSETIQLDSEISHEVLENKVAPACDPVQLDSETDASLENVKSNNGEGVIEIEEKGNSCLDREEISKTSVAVPEAVKTDSLSSDPLPATGVVQMEVEITNEEYVECTSTALQSGHNKTFVDSGATVDPLNPRSSIEGNDVKEDENMHEFSVPETVAGDAEAMIKGFKDHEGGKFPQFVDGESFEIISDVSVPNDNPSIFNSIPLNKGSGSPVEDDLELKSGSDQIAEEFPIEGEANVALQSDHIKTFVDSGAAIDSVNPRSSIDGNDVKEDENVHMFSVPDNAEVGNDEAMIKGFKDNEGGKFPQFVDGESFEVISDVKHSAPEHNPIIFNSILLNEVTGFPAKDSLELKSGSGQIAEQFPVEGETNVAHSNITVSENHSSEGFETLTTEAVEIENSHSTQTISAGYDAKALPNVNPIVLPAEAEAIQANKSLGQDYNGGYDKSKAERCNEAGNDYNEDNEKNSCTGNIIVISEPATVLQELNVTERMNLSGDERATAVELNKIEQSKEFGIETVERVSASISAEDLSGMSKTSPESIGDLVAQGNAISASEGWLAEPECTNFGSISDSQDSVQETYKVRVEHVGVLTATTEADTDGGIELLKKSAQDNMMKESPTPPSETSSSIGNATNARDFSTIASNEGETNLVVQQLGAPVTDFSTDSISQTDSLEGHWGSVSDVAAINGTETLPSKGSQASVEAEKQSSNSEAALEKQPSDRSDVFEAPSFMTLVESTTTGGGDERDAASGIRSQPGLQQQSPAPLQAGWFPSITHVVNASPGRKKNEELIAKVTNWSDGKQTSPLKSQQHTPLKNLLGEANADADAKSKSPNSKENAPVQKDETSTKVGSALTVTVSSILSPEAPVSEPTKKEEGKEWNSPARYPTDIKRERKVKRPYWAQFMCCSSREVRQA